MSTTTGLIFGVVVGACVTGAAVLGVQSLREAEAKSAAEAVRVQQALAREIMDDEIRRETRAEMRSEIDALTTERTTLLAATAQRDKEIVTLQGTIDAQAVILDIQAKANDRVPRNQASKSVQAADDSFFPTGVKDVAFLTGDALRENYVAKIFGSGGNLWRQKYSTIEFKARELLGRAKELYGWDDQQCFQIQQNKFWQGMTAEQLYWSIGAPDRVFDSNTPSGESQSWHYRLDALGTGRNRFILENRKLTWWTITAE